jgi:two-component system catabolic regulation response regulator CreB
VKAKIVIVEDEPAIADAIQYALQSEGLQTQCLPRGLPLLPLMQETRVDLVILDVGLPDVTGFDLLKQVRRTHPTPIILLTARTAEIDRVLGLEMGADDYVAKPFSPRELAARVKAVLRRAVQTTPPAQSAPSGVFAINASKRVISFFGQPLELSRYEYEILATFIARPGHVYSREQLMDIVWESPETSLDRTVDAHVKNLRAKLRLVRPDLEAIVTHRGTGYSLNEDLRDKK